MALSTAIVFDAVVEFRLDSQSSWAPASLRTVMLHNEGNHALRVDVVDADGETVLFGTTFGEHLGLQCDATQLEDKRRIDVYDESNDHQVQLTFSDREEGKSFLLSLVAGNFRVTGCVAPTVFVVNADAVRRHSGVEHPDTQAFQLSLQVQRATLFQSRTLSTTSGATGVLGNNTPNVSDTQGSCIVGGSDAAALAKDPVESALLSARVGLLIAAAFDPSQLAGGTGSTSLRWLPETLRDALHTDEGAHHICAVLFQVSAIEASEDARKESIKQRLQRQGAHSMSSPLPQPGGSKTLRHVTASNDSFGAPIDSSSKQSTRQPATEAVGEPQADEAVTQSKKKKGRRPVEGDKTDAPVDAAGEPPAWQRKSKTSTAETEAAPVHEDHRDTVTTASRKQRKPKAPIEEQAQYLDDESSSSPIGDITKMNDYAQLLEIQVKLDKKKQRLLKFEAELLLTLEQAEQGRLANEARAAELSRQESEVDATRQLLQRQRDQNDAVVRMMVEEDERARYNSRVPAAGTPNNTKMRGVAAGGNRVGKGEREPLIGAGLGAYAPSSIQGPEAGFVLRVDHPFYDNTGLPPSVERCYGVTAAFLRASHHPAGSALLLALLGGGVGLISWSVAEHSSSCHALWPLAVLYALAGFIHVVTIRHKTALYDGLHRVDQSCTQFDHVAFIYQRKGLFLMFPIIVVAVSLLSLLALLADVPVLTAVGIIIGTTAATLAFGSFSLFLHLVTSVAWDRVCAVIPQESGALCSRLAIRRVSAHYQFVKALVTSVSVEWSFDIFAMLTCLVTVMAYCLYAAIELHSYTSLLVCNALFTWSSAFSFLVLRAITGWQRATLSSVGVVSLHVDRWARGDYNAEGDLRLEDYVALQQSLFFATQGSAYAKWSLRLFDDDSTLGRVWLWGCAALTLLSAAFIPVTVLYHFDTWDI